MREGVRVVRVGEGGERVEVGLRARAMARAWMWDGWFRIHSVRTTSTERELAAAAQRIASGTLHDEAGGGGESEG